LGLTERLKNARLLARFLREYNDLTPPRKGLARDMLLTLDVGNTNVTLGVFDGEKLRATWRFATDVEKLPDEFGVLILSLVHHEGLTEADISEAVIACVVPDLEPVFEQVCQRYFGVKPLHVTAGVRTGLRILYDTPRDVGADRVADAVAAIKEYGPPLIVVDLGTATVFDAITREGDYLGGAIAPGLGIAAEALYRRAAKLTRVELERPKSAIGRNTIAAIQSGILFGYVGLIEGIVSRMKQELGGEAKVIGTGGYAEIIGRETQVIDHINPNLTLEGLRLIHELNKA
jgi:type III pantothenate kinase